MRGALLAAGLTLCGATAATAGDDWTPPVTDALTRQECGSCHLAFPPAFLPARSWGKIMDGLKDHFGDDASLAPDVAAQIRTYLSRHAGDVDPRGLGAKAMRRLDPQDTPLRITQTPFFMREHRFSERVWRDPKVVTKSNCAACHTGAERGIWED